MTDGKLHCADFIGPEIAEFATMSGRLIDSRAADGFVTYRAVEEVDNLAFLVLFLNGTGLHIALDRQTARQLRDGLDQILESFPAPVQDLG